MFTRRVFLITIVAGISILAFTASAQQPATKEIEVVEIGTVYSLPSPLLDVLGTVNPGERFTVYATSGPEWYKIDFHGKTGYIPRAIVKLVPHAIQQPAAPVREKPATQPATGEKTVATKPAATKPAAVTPKKPAPAVTEKPAAPAVESENTEPVAVVPPMEVTGEADAVNVEAESGSNLSLYLIIGAAIFLGLIFLLIKLERPEESATDFLHHQKP